MDRSPTLERLADRLRRHPFAVDAGLAALVFVGTVLVIRTGVQDGTAAVLGFLFCVPLAWRRVAPVAAACAVVGVGLLQLFTYDGLMPADVAAPIMVHALAA
jgi:hypothetical protein